MTLPIEGSVWSIAGSSRKVGAAGMPSSNSPIRVLLSCMPLGVSGRFPLGRRYSQTIDLCAHLSHGSLRLHLSLALAHDRHARVLFCFVGSSWLVERWMYSWRTSTSLYDSVQSGVRDTWEETDLRANCFPQREHLYAPGLVCDLWCLFKCSSRLKSFWQKSQRNFVSADIALCVGSEDSVSYSIPASPSIAASHLGSLNSNHEAGVGKKLRINTS